MPYSAIAALFSYIAANFKKPETPLLKILDPPLVRMVPDRECAPALLSQTLRLYLGLYLSCDERSSLSGKSTSHT